jgi:hypothetical protein
MQKVLRSGHRSDRRPATANFKPTKTPEDLAAWNEKRSRQLYGYRCNARRAGTITAQTHIGRSLSASLKRAGLAIVDLRTNWLRYIDAQGRVWQEDTRSAEQLIRDWQKEHRREKKKEKRGPTHPTESAGQTIPHTIGQKRHHTHAHGPRHSGRLTTVHRPAEGHRQATPPAILRMDASATRPPRPLRPPEVKHADAAPRRALPRRKIPAPART